MTRNSRGAGGRIDCELEAVDDGEMGLPRLPRMLVVDDEEGLLNLISSILLASGYQSDLARTVSEACSAIGRSSYDVAFLDLGLPDGSGFSILESLIEMSPECVVVVITGMHDLQTAVKSIRKGAFDYITKPFSVMLMRERLASVIEEWKSRVFTHAYQRYLEKVVKEKTKTLSSARVRIEHVCDTTVHALGAALDLRDPETEGHCRRVSHNGALLGEKLGIAGKELKDLKWGSYLHDIGKIGIPGRILQKPSALTEEEMTAVKKHSQLGHSMIKNIDFLAEAGQVVLYHHEKWDGSGYPVGLRGRDIPLFARIFAVSDAFDAMIVDRPYRKALSFDEVSREIRRCSGSHFDPEVSKTFLKIPISDLRAGSKAEKMHT
jgi:response regulator RpfG family c-di-GMP phosphodiesterase